MTRARILFCRGLVAATALIAPVWLGLALGAGANDDSKGLEAAAEKPAAAQARYMGTAACSLCHDNGAPRFKTDLVKLDEYHIWAADDKQDRAAVDAHHLAYKSLLSPRAKEMERQMGHPDGWATSAESGCLNCHATSVRADNCDRSLNVAAELAQGVGCEACHGPSSLWIDKHWKRADWRDDKQLTAAAKHDRERMTNIRDPAVQTTLCLSCHLGSVAEGKLVTHEMFAAGHPPLPPFEIETFLDNMPRHWQPAAEKSADVQAYLGYHPLQWTRAVALECLVEVRGSIQMLVDQADEELRTPRTEQHPGLAEFGLYDCAACHHELVLPSQRQERGFGGFAPGRPALRYWTMPLARLGLSAARSVPDKAGDATLDKLLEPLQTATSRGPFGDPAAVGGAARQAVAGLDKLIKSLGEQDLDAAAARHLVEELCRLSGESPLDFDSSRQVAAAIRAVVEDLGDKANAKVIATAAALQQMAAETNYDNFSSGAFRDKLKELADALGAK